MNSHVELAREAVFGPAGGVPTTGLYCLVLALTECARVDVYGIGVGTMKKSDLNDLEYFKDPHFRGWDARHNAEAERTLLRVLASRVWRHVLAGPGLGRAPSPATFETLVH